MFVMCSVSNVQLLNLFSRLFSSLKGKAKVAGIISVNRGYNGNGWNAHEVYCVYMGAFCLFSAWKPKREEMKFVLWHLSKRLCVCVVLWTDEQHIILHFSSVDCVCLPLPPGNCSRKIQRLLSHFWSELKFHFHKRESCFFSSYFTANSVNASNKLEEKHKTKNIICSFHSRFWII